jgi:hypothetical protein
MIIWLTQGQDVPECERYMTQSPKMMIIIVWSFISFHVIGILPKSSKFNLHHYVSVILQILADWHVGEILPTD